ncbi:MAG: hypothetical protein AAGD23_03975 [Pseudomonadota bacterium]
MVRLFCLVAALIVGSVSIAQASDSDLRARFIAATTASGGAGFAQDQAGCVFDRFAAKADDIRTLGLVLAMEGQQKGTPDVAFMIQNQQAYDAAVKACGAGQ